MTKRIPMKGGDEYDGLTKATEVFAVEKRPVKEDQTCI
jgi:hypothetical protein